MSMNIVNIKSFPFHLFHFNNLFKLKTLFWHGLAFLAQICFSYLHDIGTRTRDFQNNSLILCHLSDLMLGPYLIQH